MTNAEKIRRNIDDIEKIEKGDYEKILSYLISFRISNHDQKTYHTTYDNLISEIKLIDPNLYHHTTSTYIIRSKKGIGAISANLKLPLGSNDHLIVIELPGSISSHFIGPSADFSELQNYIPSITKI